MRKRHGLGDLRRVTLMKGEDEGLGMSITVSKHWRLIFFFNHGRVPLHTVFHYHFSSAQYNCNTVEGAIKQEVNCPSNEKVTLPFSCPHLLSVESNFFPLRVGS